MEPQKLVNLIGNTPLVIATNLVKNKNVQLLLKLEGNNPGGSVKDRAAYNMIVSALERGDIKKGDKLIEATSGNTGIALAMIANRISSSRRLYKGTYSDDACLWRHCNFNPR